MRALVTGASGFIGRRLVDALCETDAPVKVLVRQAHNFYDNHSIVPIVADLSETASTNHRLCEDVDTVFHLAGYAHASDANDKLAALIHRQVTVGGTRLLLEQASRAGVKHFVFVSSVKAMGEGGEKCLEEGAVALPVTEYGRAKLEAEQLVLELGRDYDMHVCVLRLPLVYGPGVKGNLLHMVRAIDRGRFPSLPEVHNKRSMVHLDDVVQALRLAVGKPKANGEVYLVTDGRVYSTHMICALIRHALGRAKPKWVLPIGALKAVAGIGDAISRVRRRPYFFNSVTLDKLVGSAWYSSEKIERDLGFKPTQTLESALPAMVKEYRMVQEYRRRGSQ